MTSYHEQQPHVLSRSLAWAPQQRGLRGSHVPSADAAGKARRAPAPGPPLLGGAPAVCPLRFPEGGRAGRAGAGAHLQAFLLPFGPALFFWRRAPSPRWQLWPGERLGGRPPPRWGPGTTRAAPQPQRGALPKPSRHPPSPTCHPQRAERVGAAGGGGGGGGRLPHQARRCAPQGHPRVSPPQGSHHPPQERGVTQAGHGHVCHVHTYGTPTRAGTSAPALVATAMNEINWF